MAKQIYIDENGNENLVSGTINTGKMLPMSTTEPTSMVADRIEACETAISGIPVIKRTSISGTTDSTGDILISGMPLANYVILTMNKRRITGETEVCYCALGGNNTTAPYIHCFTSTGASFVSKPVTIDIWYIDAI